MMHFLSGRSLWQGASLSVAATLLSAGSAMAADTAKPVTYAKDVAPIFQEKCQGCHRPNQVAPMSLLTYQDVRPWARSIKAKVQARLMPPWHIDKTVGIQSF